MSTQPPLRTTPFGDRATPERAGSSTKLWTVQWGRLFALLAFWTMRSRTRRILGQLDDRQLADIGLTRRQALAESEKPLWRC